MATNTLSPTTPGSRQIQRLQKDLDELQKNPLSSVTNLELSAEGGFNQLTGILVGPEGSDYAGGQFPFAMIFPHEYPFQAPDFIFQTPITHPNVHPTTGTACHEELLATWGPSTTIRTFLTKMHDLLARPNYDTPIQLNTTTTNRN